MVGHLKQNQKIILQVALGLLFVTLGIYFFKHEIGELSNVRRTLSSADRYWMVWGFVLLLAYVLVQGLMYQKSFEAIHEKIRLSTGLSLYLKRNLVGVFLPAGMVTNLLFYNESVERTDGVSKTQTYFASSVFTICTIVSGIVIGIPALVWLIIKQSVSGKMMLGVMLVVILLGGVTALVISIIRHGWVYHILEKRAPAFVQLIHQMSNQAFDLKKFWMVVGLSILIEVIGISHLYIAVKALGGSPTLAMAAIGYALVLLLLISSPFLRGIGAVEVALTYALTLFGLSSVLAISVAFLFRFFEFWAVLLLGLLASVAQRDNIALRLIPVIMLFLLGVVNIVSGITPALPERLEFLSWWLPMKAMDASIWLIILSGIFMLAVSVYLVKGLRNAWIAALILSGLSLIAHLTKGIEWEEATVALVTFGSLIYQRHYYSVKPDLKLARRSLFPGLVAVSSAILFGTISFWLLNPRHFNADYALWDGFRKALSGFFLLNVDLNPATPFGKQFLLGLNILGGVTLAYLAFLLFRPVIRHPATTIKEDHLMAKSLVEKFGRGSLDDFKTYKDKKLWFSKDPVGFIAFKTSRNYAIALENPVCEKDDSLTTMVIAFDAYCKDNGLRTAYYRIPETAIQLYEKSGKKLIPVGEVAVMNLEKWTLEGFAKNGIRNEVNELSRQGYTFKVNEPPQNDAFLQHLKSESKGWLKEPERPELVFSRRLFDEKELKNQVILSLENPGGMLVGFINLIPDYAPGEASFDLKREAKDAPEGTMVFLFVKMFEYLKGAGFKTCSLGMVPAALTDDPEKVQHYKSLRAFKEKFNPGWQRVFLAYEASFDLIYLPSVLDDVFER